ncbi:MAG: ATP synthase F1 subunit epsilon [bacterium]
MKNIDVQIITPERRKYQGKANSIIAPGFKGLFGILYMHAPMFNSLETGYVIIKGENEEKVTFSVSGGFLEVSENRVKILADTAENTADIDIERAQRARDRAKERLNNRTDKSISRSRAEIALYKAINRISAATKFGSR